jgi:electron transfer flavoprotein beta subunit
MRIVVLVKEVPDTYGDRKLDLETGLADRGASEAVLDEIGERALEVALSHADAHAGTEVVLLSMSPESAVTSLRKGLAMGAASAVQVVDERLAGADLGLTAEVLAAAVARAGFDLVITGNQSTDGSGGILPAMIAERLRVAQLTALVSVDLTDDAVRGQRRTESASPRSRRACPRSSRSPRHCRMRASRTSRGSWRPRRSRSRRSPSATSASTPSARMHRAPS